MRNRYKVLLLIVLGLVVLLSGFAIYMKFFRDVNKEVNQSSVVHKIEEFGYTLDDRDSSLMKEEFYKLENIMAEDEINYEEYAKSISKLFVIDLFTIDNKINKYDIGSLEYLLDSEKEKFKNIILDTIYDGVLDNSFHDREQELPIVKIVTVNSVSKDFYKNGDNLVDAYVIDLTWEYENDLGYDRSALITLIKDKDKLCVVEYSPKDINVGEEE